MPVTNSCFLMQSTGAVPKPADLKRLLENKDGVVMAKSPTEVKVKVVGTIEDRSHLIDEMADLCAKLPIYLVTAGELDTTNAVQPTNKGPPKRIKRGWVQKWVCNWGCRRVCRRICGGWVCATVCVPRCSWACQWIWVLVG
ncbi:hypothetical protein OS493_027313 [Desmophyllum pertusum]|uniref:BRICHOS domain-containing protein n=1 Tax=Desmophyllum pertusum TaxID=174260 RepID=A0A9W9Z0W9_9CNID|nr:hypothetical protein OS493_027313 [Desmophyllum pertusum]